jgi:hypothetical protein
MLRSGARGYLSAGKVSLPRFNDGGNAPKGFLELVVVIVVLFVIGSETCTRRLEAGQMKRGWVPRAPPIPGACDLGRARF